MGLFCDVALPVPLDQLFTYAVNGATSGSGPVVGARVLVPFSGQKLMGVVVRVHEDAPAEGFEIKPVQQVLDEAALLPDELMKLAEWIASYYVAPLGEVLRGMLPLAAEVKRHFSYRIAEAGRKVLYEGAEKGSSRRSKLTVEEQNREYAVLNYLEGGEQAKMSAEFAVGWARPFVPGATGWRGEYGYTSELDFNTREPERAFKWVGTTGSVLARLVGCHDDYGQAINDAGQVAVNLSSFELGGAALFDPRCGLVRLPGLGVGVDTTRANAMNATGQIVGYAQTAGGVEHPVRWDSGAVTDLGLMPGYVEGQALGINDAGVIVGGLSDQNFPFGLRDVVGFIVVNGVMYNLNTLIPPGTGFTINEAARINNAGQILVAMNPPPALGVTRYAVLTPTP